MLLKDVIKGLTEKYIKENPPDFITHLNYVTLLSELSKNLDITYKPSIKNCIQESTILNKKLNMIKLTFKGLDAEHEVIQVNPDYAVVCVSWISVKAYYLLYNLCLIIKYLITGKESSFNSTHGEILRDFKGYIQRRELMFTQSKFNDIYLCSDILKWKAKSGSNIKITSVNIDERYLQIIKKLAAYSIEEYKRRQKINSIRSKDDKISYNTFISSAQINICEFFYWYRIKANYRDLEYLDKDIDDDKFELFYNNYYDLTMNFFKAFKKLVNELALIRLGREILSKT